MVDFEKLGVFYLGRRHDLESGKTLPEPVLYDSRDLVTHAVCVGMTGSGKTGLCIALLEEAALDGIPALVIDPKGDLGNLLLTFPELRAADFRPWINEDDPRRQGLEPEAYAAAQAELWKRGLAEWGQSPERIRRLREAAEFAIYTPGSEAGLPLSVVASFAAPPAAVRDDADLFRQRIATTATSLLGLVGIEADPIQSREHILLSSLLQAAWERGEDLDLGRLIERVQKPPLERVGVMDLDTFYPAKDRFALAMALNGLLASPSFASWLRGEPMDLQQLLYTTEGKPRVAIISIAHLGDAERMFLVALLLNQTLGWVRGLSGTTSLRAIVYMDEVFGFLPPVANPPSKLPLLTLLKQARAFGVGVVLATQNPVDLDYKALSNTGTWLLGRLQTERDKARVLDGLEGAAATTGGSLDRGELERALSGLKKRIFLMHNVHEDGPAVIESRWAMSYLRGPLTLAQIRSLTGGRSAAPAPTAADGGPATSPSPAAAAAPAAGDRQRPVLPPEVPQVFLPGPAAAAPVLYQPVLLGVARARYHDAKLDLDHQEVVALLADLGEVTVDWQRARPAAVSEAGLGREPAAGATFASLPPRAADPKSYAGWSRAFTEAVSRDRRLELLRSPATRQVSRPGETEAEFRVRLAEGAREARDRAVEELRRRYAARVTKLEERLRRAEERIEREKSQASAQKMQTAISMGATVMGVLFGRKRASTTNIGRATTAMRGVGRSSREAQDVDRAEESAETVRRAIAELEAELEGEIKALESRQDPRTEALESVVLRPKKAHVETRLVALAWEPIAAG